MSEPAGDDVPDVLRDDDSGSERSRLDAFQREQAQRLGHKKRISIGLLVQGCDRLRRDDRRSGLLDVLPHIGLAQPRKQQTTAERLARNLCQHRRNRLSRDRIHVAEGAEEQDPGRAELAGEELEQEQGGRVGGVQIVQHHHEWPLVRGVPQELGGGLEQAEARAFGLERSRLGQIGEDLAQLGQDLGELAGARAELPT